jgi:hypothetical protein
MVLSLHGCCGDGINPGEVSVGGDPIYRAWHNNSFNTQSEPVFIVAPGIASGWSTYRTRIMQILNDLIAEFPIDTQRIIVTGFSMGGAGTMDYISATPTFFSAALPIAAAVGGPVNGNLLKNVPIWGGVGDNDGWKDEHMMTVEPIRTANGDSRGAVPYVTGVNPRFDIYPNTGHGPGMEGLYTQAEVVPWALSRVNDGNNYPNIRFTQATPDHGQTLDAATTSVNVTATAFDDGGAIVKVDFFLDGNPVSTDSEAPYEATVNGLTPGDHVIEATCTDNGTTQGFALSKTATATLKFSVQSTPAVADDALPAAVAGRFYRHRFALQGGNAPFSWSLASGVLPLGLKLWEAGTIEGVAYETGQFTISVAVKDKDLDSAGKQFTLTVQAAPPGAPAITNYVENARAVFYPGAFEVGEPYAITGYGFPAGEFHLGNFNPVYDVITDIGSITDAIVYRASTVQVDINSATPIMMSFNISEPAIIHVAYPRNNNNAFPSWLSTLGFTSTGEVIRAERQDFYDYAKEYPAGTVSLPGNDGTTTGASKHYLAVVEPKNPIGVQPGPTLGSDHRATFALRGRRLRVDAQRRNSVVILHDAHGRLVLEQILDGVSADIGLDRLSRGVYLMRVRSGGRVLIRPLLLK